MKYSIGLLSLIFLGGGCVSASPSTPVVEPIVVEEVDANEVEIALEVPEVVANSMITVTQPITNATVASPLVVTGEARGGWYFEASFPVVLKDVTGATIASGVATAIGDWMTNDFVPFSVTLTFPAQTPGSVGTLTLVRDNPSGLPENAEWLDVAVVF